jgi:hypothetical protein
MHARCTSEEEKVKIYLLFDSRFFNVINGKRHKYGPQDPCEKQERLGCVGLNKLKIGMIETQPHEAFRKLLHCE